MKINRFRKINEELQINLRYEIRKIQRTGGWYIPIPPIEDDGNGDFNYDEYDLKSVVSYLIKYIGNSEKLEIYKITDSLVTNDIIDKVKEEIKLDNNTKKYNL